MAKTIPTYSFEDFNHISFDGFNFSLPQETIKIIQDLAREVGSPSYVKTPIFQKRDNPLKTQPTKENSTSSTGFRKKRNKNNEILNDEDWETFRTFQPTKIEKKEGIDAKFDIIRSNLNKLTDKSYLELKEKIMDTMKEIVNDESNSDASEESATNSKDILVIGKAIFDIASTNRFYSKIYADLYAELIGRFEIMKDVFYNSFDTFLEMFNNIEYIDPSVDYDKFCKINKDNEKRRALSAFFVNLMINKVIDSERITLILKNLLVQINSFISIENKKNEVDEITENIAILYKKELFEPNINVNSDLTVDGITITEFIVKIANSKPKDYQSLTNKTIFKFMDMIEM
jgi:hypothetical protein